MCKRGPTDAENCEIDPASVSSESMSDIVIYAEEADRNVNNNFNKRKLAMAVESHIGKVEARCLNW